jgi:alpha-maltose-1-phosphate synthase
VLIFVHPTGNANVRADLAALDRAHLLARFYTTIAWREDRAGAALLPERLRRELSRRAYPGVDPRRIATMPWREGVRLLALRLDCAALTRHETGWASIDRVYAALDAKAARAIRRGGTGARGVYAYEDGALAAFGAAAAAGMRRFYELPIGYWRAARALFLEERERRPDWAATLEGLRDSAAKLARKDAELAAADHVIVPSDFVRETLGDRVPAHATIDVIPYGAPVDRPPPVRRQAPGPLRLLYVGHLTQRKGVAYLFDAMRRLGGAATLTLVGPRPAVACPALAAELARHRWLGTVTHARVLEIMAEHDLFVFPSLFEGLALVLLEAMAQGLPVVTTRNAGGAMLVEEGGNGFLVPIRDPDAIAERVLLLAQDRERLQAMSAAARLTAERLSWQRRAERFVATIEARLGGA